MKRKAVSSAAITAALVLSGWNQVVIQSRPPAVQAATVAARVVTLPEDGGAWHTTLFLHKGWKTKAKDRQLVGWFASDPILSSLKAQTHYHQFTREDRLFQTRFSRAVTELPAVMVQAADGAVWYKVSGDNVPETGAELSEQVAKIFRRPFFRRHVPRPQPGPEPAPEPDIEPMPDVTPVIPDLGGPEETSGTFPWIVAAIIAALAGGGSLAYNRKKDKV